MSTTTSTKQQLSGKLPQNLSILQEEQAGCLCLVQVLESYCRNLIKKPWAFNLGSLYESYYFGGYRARAS